MRYRPGSISRRDFIFTGGATCLAVGFIDTAYGTGRRLGIQGQRAPELDVNHWIDADGESTDFMLSSAEGKWVFLKCFQSWCPGCHSHGFPTLKKVSDALADNPAVVIAGIQTTFEGFRINTRDKVRELQLRYELRITMGHDAGDPDGDPLPSTMRNYRTGGTPWMILIDPDRTVVFNDYGLNGDRLIEALNQMTG